jgi:hypothetical protein
LAISEQHGIPLQFVKLLEEPLLDLDVNGVPTPAIAARSRPSRTALMVPPTFSTTSFPSETSHGSAAGRRVPIGSKKTATTKRPTRDERPDDGVGAPAAASSAAKRQRAHAKADQVSNFIKADEEMYALVLQYNPINLQRLRQELADAGIKRSRKWLIEYLQDQGIPFVDSEKKPQRRTFED